MKKIMDKIQVLNNYGRVIYFLQHNPDLVMREVSRRVGITERAIQKIVADFIRLGFLKRERIGRKNKYTVLKNVDSFIMEEKYLLNCD